MNLETMRLLVAKGLSAEDILEIAESIGAPKRSAGAERQARYRARKAGHDVTSDVTRDGNEVTDPALSRPPNENNSNPPTHTHPDRDIPRTRKAEPFPKPEWADPQVWSDWMEVRKTKKGRNTATAYTGFLADIAKLTNDEWPPGRLLAYAVAQSWAGIYEPKEGYPTNVRPLRSTNDVASLRGSRPDPALDMLKQAQRELQAEAEREAAGFDWPPRLALPPH